MGLGAWISLSAKPFLSWMIARPLGDGCAELGKGLAEGWMG